MKSACTSSLLSCKFLIHWFNKRNVSVNKKTSGLPWRPIPVEHPSGHNSHKLTTWCLSIHWRQLCVGSSTVAWKNISLLHSLLLIIYLQRATFYKVIRWTLKIFVFIWRHCPGLIAYYCPVCPAITSKRKMYRNGMYYQRGCIINT